MHRKTTQANAITTEPSTQTAHVAAMTMDTQPLARPTYTVSSSSTAVAQSRHTTETPDRSIKHQPNSRRTNWKKLKEQASRDQSKRRETLIAVNPDACFCCSLISNKKNLPDDNG